MRIPVVIMLWLCSQKSVVDPWAGGNTADSNEGNYGMVRLSIRAYIWPHIVYTHTGADHHEEL